MSNETKQTLQEFIARNRITMRAERTDQNLSNPDWKNADHWKVVFSRGRSRMTTYFSMAEKIYKAVEKSSEKLRKFLGEDLFDQLLWHTERL